jgi:hypothetical protein
MPQTLATHIANSTSYIRMCPAASLSLSPESFAHTVFLLLQTSKYSPYVLATTSPIEINSLLDILLLNEDC